MGATDRHRSHPFWLPPSPSSASRSSRSRFASTTRDISASESSCSGVSRSMNRRRISTACNGAAASMTRLPSAVSTTSAPRPTGRHSSRLTSPRPSIRVTCFDKRDFSHPSRRPRSTALRRCPGASETVTSTSKSASEMPESR